MQAPTKAIFSGLERPIPADAASPRWSGFAVPVVGSGPSPGGLDAPVILAVLDGGAGRGVKCPPFRFLFHFPILEDDSLETLLGRPLEVEVRDSIEKAMKILKQKMSKEGILQEIKRRRYYEKPSVKKKRKMREARKRRRREQKRRVVR
jgi:small subunit ribosomal protein S21